ncbi:hypothetical protein ACWIUD_08285 [Helicobacter sp. 23-1044]
MLKKIYKKIMYPFLRVLYKPILDEVRENSVDKATLWGIEMLLRKEFMAKYKILSPQKSIEFLCEKRGSFIRLGDGDLPILCDKGGGMHKFSTTLKERLMFALDSANRLNIPIGINVNLVKNVDLKDSGFFYACEYLNAYGAIKYLPNDRIYFDGVALRYSPMDFYVLDSKIQNGGGQKQNRRI